MRVILDRAGQGSRHPHDVRRRRPATLPGMTLGQPGEKQRDIFGLLRLARDRRHRLQCLVRLSRARLLRGGDHGLVDRERGERITALPVLRERVRRHLRLLDRKGGRLHVARTELRFGHVKERFEAVRPARRDRRQRQDTRPGSAWRRTVRPPRVSARQRPCRGECEQHQTDRKFLNHVSPRAGSVEGIRIQCNSKIEITWNRSLSTLRPMR